jgi:hypothetical protein
MSQSIKIGIYNYFHILNHWQITIKTEKYDASQAADMLIFNKVINGSIYLKGCVLVMYKLLNIVSMLHV